MITTIGKKNKNMSKTHLSDDPAEFVLVELDVLLSLRPVLGDRVHPPRLTKGLPLDAGGAAGAAVGGVGQVGEDGARGGAGAEGAAVGEVGAKASSSSGGGGGWEEILGGGRRSAGSCCRSSSSRGHLLRLAEAVGVYELPELLRAFCRHR